MREAALKAIDDALYGLMMVLDGLRGALKMKRTQFASRLRQH